MPDLEAAQKRATKKDFKEGWWQAIICALTRAAVSGETLPKAYDAHIRFNGMKDDYYYQFIRPLVQRLLYLLPEERREKVLLTGLGDKTTYWRALRMISVCPTEPVLTLAFSQLLEFESGMKYEQGQDLTEALKGLHDGPNWVKWVLASGGGKGCKDALKSSMNWQAFEALEKELQDKGVEKAKELDGIDKILEMASEQGNKGEPVYLLRRLESADASDFNVIGGAAPGVFADRWPMFEEEPMAHLFTLDLVTMPAMHKAHKARTISVFCASPENNEAYQAGNEWTAIVYSTDDQLKATGELPADIEAEPEARFEAVEAHVNMDNQEMRKAIYGCGARVMGEPMWLQQEEHWGNFLMQFDESFCYMNLGDMGIMYVFDDTAFWQCH